MSKICAKCDKPVYPLEELKCLDKIWHKGCFKCWDCGMSLSMKNYKGFDRKPYCSAHYPQTKATVVADTPELQRLSQASKIQSQAKYHEEFEKKIKGSKIQVADDPETQRLKQLSSVVSQVEYKGLREKVMDMEAKRQNVAQPEVPEKGILRPATDGQDNYINDSQKPSPYSDRSVSHSIIYGADGRVESQPQRKIGSIADYDPTNYSSTLPHSSLRQTQEWEETVVLAPSPNYPSLPPNEPPSSGGCRYSSLERPSSTVESGVSSASVGVKAGVHADAKLYQGDAVTGGQQVAPSGQAEDQQYLVQQQQQQQQQQLKQQQQLQQQQLREQQLRDQQSREQQQRDQQLREQQQREQQLRQQQQQLLLQQQQRQQDLQYRVPYEQPVLKAQQPTGLAGAIFQAMYDYDAQDEDEVSFIENDLILNCDPIDEGWMYGTIQRTGQRGMLPANYVERVQ